MSELYHHGIEGQRKGVRNGPPYPLDPEDHSAEQIRRNPEIRAAIRKEKAAIKAEKKSTKRFNRFIKVSQKSSRQDNQQKLKKTAESMTDEELKKATARLTLENNYMDQVRKNEPAREKKMKWAREAVSSALKTVGTQVATVAVSKAANALISKALGVETEWVNPMTGRVPIAKNVKKEEKNTSEPSKPETKQEKVKPEKTKPEKVKPEKQKPVKTAPAKSKSDYLPKSYKLVPVTRPDGRIVWVDPETRKKTK